MLPRRTYSLLLIASFIIFLIFGLNIQANAASLANVSVLLSRNATSTAATALICVTTPGNDNGIEDNVKITFPNSFTVSSNTANWTVSTANIPSDSTPWPGIGTSTGVSGKTVTFPSSNLSINTKYCYRTTSSNSLTTAASSGSHKGTISTFQGISGVDSAEFGLSVGSDQIEVNAVVPASSTDFEADAELTSPSGDSFSQNTTLSYTLTYGSQLTSSSNITVEAQWSLGTVSGSGSPTVEILDYVVGSASNGYNSTTPVVDLVNRKITWTISSFPASTSGETVTFQLKTNDNYTGSQSVSFDVTGRVIGPGTQTPDSTVTKNYLYSSSSSPTATPTTTASSSSGDSTNPISTPTPTTVAPAKLAITQMEIRKITPTEVAIYIRLNKNSSITLNYGLTKDNLSFSAKSLKTTNEYLISLNDLNPDNVYFYKVLAQSGQESATSDIFTFKTTKKESTVKISNGTFLVISNNLRIFDQSLVNENKIDPVVIIPNNVSFTFTLAFENSFDIKSIQAFLRKKNVLSAASGISQNIQNISLIQTKDGEFTGRLPAGITPSDYELFIRISDYSGNIFEEKAGTIKITLPISVFESGTNNPVEGARVTLYSYNFDSKLYEQIHSGALPINNPEKTLPDGTTTIVLPQGRYKADVKAWTFKDKSVEFVLGESDNDTYPIIYLERDSINPISLASYYLETGKDQYSFFSNFISTHNESSRLFELVAFLSILLFSVIVFSSLLFRTHNSPKSIFHYIKHLVHHTSSSERPKKGIIKDHDNISVSKALVSFIKNGEVIYQTSTNINGLFYTAGKEFDHIEISKIGFENETFPFSHQIDEKIPSFHLKKPDSIAIASISGLFDFSKAIVGLLFEVLIVLLILIELAFIPTFGILKILPLLILSISMIFIYLTQVILKK